MPFSLYSGSAETSAARRSTLFLCLGLAAVMVVSGLAALLGWGLGASRLAAPLPGWRPLPPIGALLSILIGLAFWQRVHGRRRSAFAAAGLCLSLALPSLLTGGRLGGPLALPFSSTVLFAIAAVGVLSELLHRRPDLEKLILILTGIGLIALSGTTAFAHTMGMLGAGPGDFTDPVPGSSIQVVATMGILGFCFLFLVWWSGFREFDPPEWLPAAAGLLGLATVILFWTTLKGREELRRIESTREAASTEQRLLQRELASVTRALVRTAEWLEVDAEPVLQERVFLALLRDIPSVEAVFHMGAQGLPVAQAPVPADVQEVESVWSGLARRDSLVSDSLIFRSLDPNQERFVVFAPVCVSGCDGAVAAIVRAEALFAPTSAANSGSHRVTISGPSGPLEAWRSSQPDTSDASPPQVFGIGGLQWSVAARPARPDGRTGNDAPSAVLFLGLVLTVLLPLTLQLGISAWKGTQERERSQLAFALDGATDGVWEIQLPGGHTVRSPALWRNLGHPDEAVPSDMAGWTALVHPDDRPALDRAMAHHLAGERESYEAEYRVKAADGSWHTLVERGRVVERTPAGAPSRVVGISADVTEARATAIAREESERRFRAVFDSSFQFQILLDSACKVLEANPITLQLAGVQADKVLGQEAWETLWWAGQPEVQERLREACHAAGGGEDQSWEQEINTAGKPTQILELSLRPIRAAGEVVSHMLLEGRDVTERRRAESSLREVDTLTTMGRVAARVAHEINNPLAGIQSAFLLIKDAVPVTHPHHAYVGSIEREIERISRVTRQLYETYRPEQDQTGTASIQLVVTDAVAFLEQVNRLREVRIAIDLTGVPATVPVPAAILRQVVYNLAQNAIDASPPGGTVEITAMADATTLRLIVRDQGPGVPEEHRELVFEPFFSTKGKAVPTSGMGLGLSLLRHTVTASGGTITVGTAVDGGAEFVVTLPLDAPRLEHAR